MAAYLYFLYYLGPHQVRPSSQHIQTTNYSIAAKNRMLYLELILLSVLLLKVSFINCNWATFTNNKRLSVLQFYVPMKQFLHRSHDLHDVSNIWGFWGRTAAEATNFAFWNMKKQFAKLNSSGSLSWSSTWTICAYCTSNWARRLILLWGG